MVCPGPLAAHRGLRGNHLARHRLALQGLFVHLALHRGQRLVVRLGRHWDHPDRLGHLLEILRVCLCRRLTPRYFGRRRLWHRG